MSAAPVQAAPGRWLAIVGIGEDGLDGLSPAAERLVAQAEVLAGGTRHLTMVPESGQRRLAWPSPLTDAVPDLLALRGRRVCVLASGDPFLHGIGATLARFVSAEEILCLPAPSSLSLAAARLGWALQECSVVSLHGRSFERLLPHLQPGARLLVLSWDGTTPARVAATLRERGMDGSRLVVLEALGGPREQITEATAKTFDTPETDPLNIVAVEVVAARGARVLPLSAGLPDTWFESDGQMTKREIRAITLSTLAPRQGETLWDIGAGSGSIGIEWMLRHPANRTIAIEPRADRAARIVRNAAAFGVPDLVLVEGEAPAALTGLPTPDAVFVGGGATHAGVLDAAWQALAPGGRLVLNAVTVETQAEAVRRFGDWGGELVQVQVARAEPVGGFHGWRAAMPVVQFSVVKP